ncbi:DUF438 domain-containing protein [Clostridium beijerinckii]|uniref:DUF438 domain-containing protein n=1 Tax=Clostridium beijerinckii TaxID=1520 RepID=UPI00156F063E
MKELTDVLEKLNRHGVSDELRKEALEIVSDINPIELSIAEQNLIEKGMNPQDLRHLCDIHMEVLKDELDKIKTKIKPGHVVDTFINEHEKILGFLTELEEINSRIQKSDNYDSCAKEFDLLKTVIDNILDAEKHHFLYPTAIEAIKDNEIWEDMKSRCDEIGYCSFTPKE